jgi:hypothetical protein
MLHFKPNQTPFNIMNNLKKVFLYPIMGVGVIMLITVLNWILTAFFALIFDTTMLNLASGPMLFMYAISFVVMIYMIVEVCNYIDQEL